MDNLLSIGDVAKLRNINVQSLRYYEKLGILIPAKINPDTGYRYYSSDQIIILDTILLCIEIGIPLKSLRNYVNSNGELEFEHLLRDGRKIAMEKIEKIETDLDSIDRTLRHVTAQKKFINRNGLYTRFIFERHYIEEDCPVNMDSSMYDRTLSRLFDICRKNSLHSLFQHGTIMHYKDGVCDRCTMFLEVLSSDSPLIHKFADGNYICCQQKREAHADPLDIFSSEYFKDKDSYVIVSCMSPDTYRYDDVVLEMQIVQ